MSSKFNSEGLDHSQTLLFLVLVSTVILFISIFTMELFFKSIVIRLLREVCAGFYETVMLQCENIHALLHLFKDIKILVLIGYKTLRCM